MQKKINKIKGSKIELGVDLSLEEFSPYVRRETERALAEVRIQGFRKGNAPRELALPHVNHDEVLRVAAERAVRESFVKIVDEQKWHVLEEPKIEVNPEVKGGLSYRADFAVMPDVALPNYEKIAKKIFGAKKEVTVDEKEVNDSLRFLAESRGARVKVEREAKNGDAVEISYSVFSPDHATTYFKDKKERIILGQEELLPGFDEKVLGKKSGEEATFSSAAPKDYHDRRLQDKTVEVTAKIGDIYEKKLPELNDEFAKSIGNFENMEALKNSIKDGIRDEKAMHEDEKRRAELLEQLTKESKVDVPELLVSDMLHGLVEDAKRLVVSQGKNWDEYLKSQNKTEEQVGEELRAKARERVVSNLVIYQIAKDANQKPSEEEVDQEAQRIAGQFAGHPPAGGIDPTRLYNYAFSILQSKKVFDYLESLAK